jgi:hypothetical protein
MFISTHWFFMLEWVDRSYTSDKALHSTYGQLDTSGMNARNRFGAAFCHRITRGTSHRLLEGFCWYAGVNWGLRISCVNLQHIMNEGLRCLQDLRSWYWRSSFLSTAIVIHETGVRQRCCARETYHLRALWLKECYLGLKSIPKFDISIATKTNQRSLSQLVSLHATTTNLT